MKGFKGQTDVPGFVYLLHFDRPFHHATHYTGWTSDLAQRLTSHRAGNGGKLVAAAAAAGIGFTVARVWQGKTHAFERYIKNEQPKHFCPCCTSTPRGLKRVAHSMRHNLLANFSQVCYPEKVVLTTESAERKS
jgi:predicted GIY-YIG superfamily endonuclease